MNPHHGEPLFTFSLKEYHGTAMSGKHGTFCLARDKSDLVYRNVFFKASVYFIALDPLGSAVLHTLNFSFIRGSSAETLL